MNKTRIIASLLCIMMLVCALPMIQASADVVTTYNSVEEILGQEVTPVFDFQFKAGFTEDQGYLHSNTGNITYTDANGIEFGASGVWRFTEGANTTPMSHGAVGFTLQMTDDQVVSVQVNKPGTNGQYVENTRAYITIKSTGIGTEITKVYDGGFQPWYKDAEYLLKDEGVNYSLYAKSDAYTEGKWILALTAPWSTTTSAGQGMRFDASSGYLKNFKVYRPSYYTLKSVIGADVATAYDFDFKADFDGTMTFTDKWAAGIETPDGATYTDENGLTMPATSSRWRFRPYGNTSWSCLSNGGNRSAVMFSMKLPEGGDDTIVTLGAPDYTGRVYLLLNTNKIAVEGGPATTDSDILPGTGWVDYLVVPDALTGGTASGFALYMKSDSLTNGEWVKKLTNIKYGSADTVDNNTTTGITISAANTCVKNLKVFSIDDVVADDATKPVGADFLYYEENFDTEPAYLSANGGNLSVGGGTFDTDNGQIVLKNEKGYAQFYLNKAGIPAGGYAEIKVRAGARMNFSLPTPDATQRIKLDMRKEKGTINNTSTAFIGDGGNTWWTYRILCNKDNTYDVYVKTEEDTAWLQLANDIAAIDPAGTGPDRIAIDQYEHVAGNAAELFSSAIDYIKIYGDAPTAPLTLTDGYGTAVLEDDDAMTYPRALRAIVTPAEAKLLVVTYQGDNMISAQIVNAADMENDSVLVNAYDGDATKVKVFLWDDFNKLKPLANVVELSL